MNTCHSLCTYLIAVIFSSEYTVDYYCVYVHSNTGLAHQKLITYSVHFGNKLSSTFMQFAAEIADGNWHSVSRFCDYN